MHQKKWKRNLYLKNRLCAGGCRLSGRHGQHLDVPLSHRSIRRRGFFNPYLLFVALFGYVGRPASSPSAA